MEWVGGKGLGRFEIRSRVVLVKGWTGFRFRFRVMKNLGLGFGRKIRGWNGN